MQAEKIRNSPLSSFFLTCQTQRPCWEMAYYQNHRLEALGEKFLSKTHSFSKQSQRYSLYCLSLCLCHGDLIKLSKAEFLPAYTSLSRGTLPTWRNLKEERESYKLCIVIIKCEIVTHQVAIPFIKSFPAHWTRLLNLILVRQLIFSIIERISIVNYF